MVSYKSKLCYYLIIFFYLDFEFCSNTNSTTLILLNQSNSIFSRCSSKSYKYSKCFLRIDDETKSGNSLLSKAKVDEYVESTTFENALLSGRH